MFRHIDGDIILFPRLIRSSLVWIVDFGASLTGSVPSAIAPKMSITKLIQSSWITLNGIVPIVAPLTNTMVKREKLMVNWN